MTALDTWWNLFAATGQIDLYLLYRKTLAEEQVALDLVAAREE